MLMLKKVLKSIIKVSIKKKQENKIKIYPKLAEEREYRRKQKLRE